MTEVEKLGKLTKQLDGFLTRTLATSTEKHNTSADRLVGARIRPLINVLSQGGIELTDELSDDAWSEFCGRIITRLDNNKTEASGIHPTVREIFSLCNQMCGDRYTLEFETNYDDLEKVLKRPDISIMLEISVGNAIESIVLPVEIKKFADLNAALHQAMGYLVSKLRNLLDMHGPTVRISGYCIGTDGQNIAVGYARIEDYELTIVTTGKAIINMWSQSTVSNNPDTYPGKETLGVRIIRTFLLSSPETLGHTSLTPPALVTPPCTYNVLKVLGRGAFCTAFLARVDPAEGAQSVVVIKREGLVSLTAHKVPLVQLQHETLVLQAFSLLRPMCGYLPSLHDPQWVVSPANPYIPIFPVGIPLEQWCAKLGTQAKRTEHAQIMYTHVCDGLRTAHRLGWCNRDVRPYNVVYNEVDRVYVVIDWGLADVLGADMHKHEGGLSFFHDDHVNAVNFDEQIPFWPDHDLASARYVAWAFKQGSKFTVPWQDLGEDTIAARNSIVGDYLL